MVVTPISEAKAQLSSLVKKALAGEEIIISRAGKPVVRLVSCARSTRREPGILRGRIHIAPDFDDFPLELAEMFGMKDR